MFNKKTLQGVKIQGKIVLVRTDFNVPLHEGKITDDLRIKAALPTINYLLEQGAHKIILISHLGRPDGQPNPDLSLRPVARHLQSLLPSAHVEFTPYITGPAVSTAVEQLPDAAILLLENLRFSPAEEENSVDFAKEIVDSTHAELFVQDGFAVVHRAHASTVAIAKLLPSVAGFLLEKEVDSLLSIIHQPARPLLIIIGGAKVSDKQPLITVFLPIADHIFVGGKIAADGYISNDPKVIVASDFINDPSGAQLDIGPSSITQLEKLIASAQTIVWNGLLGKAEEREFAAGSLATASQIGQKVNTTTIIAGGDTAGFVEQLQKIHPELNYSLVSTGGGASLELLSGQKLPGIEALQG